MGKEILTLQLGHKANYVATHFWNSQVFYLLDSLNSQEANFDYQDTNEKPVIDNDVHFRAGIGQGGVETYTPRTLIYDLKGAHIAEIY
jgi:Misato Segment II tubulin-like domain